MKLKSYNEGGSTAPLATPVPTGAPGSATAAIEAYLGGTSTGSPTINYTPGDPYKAKLAKITAEREAKEEADRLAKLEHERELARLRALSARVVDNSSDDNVYTGPSYVYDGNASAVDYNSSDNDPDYGGGFSDTPTEDAYSDGYNRGGMVDDDKDNWGTDPLAKSNIPTAPLAQASHAVPSGNVAQPQGSGVTDTLKKAVAGQAIKAGITKAGLAGGPAGVVASQVLPKLFGFNYGGEVTGNNSSPHIMKAGEWVGKRTLHLNHGGMALPEAEMQAYNEMQGMTGPDLVGAEYIMEGVLPPDSVMLMSGKPMSPKKAEMDQKEMAFMMDQKRKEESHQQSMMNKQEVHDETMKQKKAPLA